VRAPFIKPKAQYFAAMAPSGRHTADFNQPTAPSAQLPVRSGPSLATEAWRLAPTTLLLAALYQFTQPRTAWSATSSGKTFQPFASPRRAASFCYHDSVLNTAALPNGLIG
jgi:hypothetical protein